MQIRWLKSCWNTIRKIYIFGYNIEPTAEVIALHIYKDACQELNIRDAVTEVRLWETSDSRATCRPTWKAEEAE